MISVILPDGSAKSIEEGSDVFDLATSISGGLARAAVGAKVNGKDVDITTRLSNGDHVQILTFNDDDGKEIFWHSSAHILAQAVTRLYPEAKPTIGPPIEVGFYYDFADLQISDQDFEKIEAEMKKIVKERLQPKRIEYASKEEALDKFNDNPFKVELIEGLEEGLSAYRQGEFEDLCRGPHIPNTKMVEGIKILKTSGAYWRGDAEKPQLTRIYAVTFPKKKQLKAYLHMLEEAKKRDHRIIGKKLDLYSFHKVGPGMPFIHPKGMVVWNELMAFWRELHTRDRYTEIKTPTMMSSELWERSGHWDYYRENMYTSEIDDKIYAIKPMNCPGGMIFYKNGQYSYRDLPMRVGEVGLVHRHEMSGALSGMFRVRSFHQDDAHIFMRPCDIKSEIVDVLKLADDIYSQFGLEYHLELSTRPEKSIGNDHDWEMTTEGLRSALEAHGKDFVVNEGDGAFYGPKIDFHIKDAIGRTWQCGTIQLDMSLPERFELVYIAEDSSQQRPIMIHRALYGSIERFFGILVEHYAGKFPLWLSPVHVRILPVAERHYPAADEFAAKLKEEGLRVEVDQSSESVNKKVRNAQLDQVNYIVVFGDKEAESDNLSVRTRDNHVHPGISRADFVQNLKDEYRKRKAATFLAS
ncbi:MAG: threonine--tRNA ligase [Acidobacteria bacterium]|nr:MAG: threonine--tRNA ligase [Acidobacteriota bacterium]